MTYAEGFFVFILSLSWCRIKSSNAGCKRVKAFPESVFNVAKLSVILTCAARFQGMKIKIYRETLQFLYCYLYFEINADSHAMVFEQILKAR